MKNKLIGGRLAADLDQQVMKVLRGLAFPEPPLHLRDVRALLDLLTRELYTEEQARGAYLRRADPEAYERELEEKYIAGAQEDRPAVAPVNALFSARAVMELLARLHPYRDDSNGDFATVTESLTGGFTRHVAESGYPPDPALVRYVGRGDVTPMLNLPLLSYED